MKNKAATFLLIILIVPITVFAQNINRKFTPKAPVRISEPNGIYKINLLPGKITADGNYIPIDTMSNAFGSASGDLNPLTFDPYSGTIAFIHRGWDGHYAANSGELWYNISTDYGVSWKRVPVGINTSNSPLLARYPSMAISNPSKGSMAGTIALFAWPELADPNNFGFYGYGSDKPVGAAHPVPFINSGTPHPFSTSAVNWASDNNPWMFWTGVYDQTQFPDASITLWRTTYFGTVIQSVPPQWADSVFSNGENIALGGQSWNGVQYYAVLGTFNAFYAPKIIASGWYPGYSKSTDNGATWSNFKVCDFRQIPRLANYQRLFDFYKGDLLVSYQGDMHVDKKGHVHLIVQVADTNSAVADKQAAIVDLFETDSGTWDATIITTDLDVTGNIWLLGPALSQMGPSSYLAFDSTRTVECVQWVNTGAGGWSDVFQSHKLLSDTAWSSPPDNVTNSGSINNTQSHLAPFLREKLKDGNTFTYQSFSMYGYAAGANGPFADTTQSTVAYGGTEEFSVTITGLKDPTNTVKSFTLNQNYPNPFNPGTIITYSLPQRGMVYLIVYDILGREVAILVNKTEEAGTHSVNFNASKLTSGLYIYTLTSGNFILSKKMMLLK